MSDYRRQEVEEAFEHLWQVGPVGEDWTAQVQLYTDDCVYFDHHYGTMNPEELGSWCNTLMNEQFPELYTAYEWHKIDGDEVETSDEVDDFVERSSPGDRVKLAVRRDETVVELKVTLARRPKAEDAEPMDKK